MKDSQAESKFQEICTLLILETSIELESKQRRTESYDEHTITRYSLRYTLIVFNSITSDLNVG